MNSVRVKVALGVIAMTLLGVVVFWPKAPAIRPPPPTPNGFDDLIAAMKVLSIPDDFSKLGTEDLRAIAISNEAALDLIRAGLAKESFIPVEYLDESTPSYLVAAYSVSYGCHLLILRGWLAEREEKWEAAAQYITRERWNVRNTSREAGTLTSDS
jgi:hypothetical protein